MLHNQCRPSKQHKAHSKDTCAKREDRQEPGLVAFYDIRPGNGAGQFFQPQSPTRGPWVVYTAIILKSRVLFVPEANYPSTQRLLLLYFA